MSNKITFPLMKNRLFKFLHIETRQMKAHRMSMENREAADNKLGHPDPTEHQYVIKFEYVEHYKTKRLELHHSNINPRVGRANYGKHWHRRWEFESHNKHKLKEAMRKFGFNEDNESHGYPFFIEVEDANEALRIVEEFKEKFYPDSGGLATNVGDLPEDHVDPYGAKPVYNEGYHYFYFFTKLGPLRSSVKKLHGWFKVGEVDIDVWFGLFRKDFKFFIVLFNWGYWWYYDIPRVPEHDWQDVKFYPEIEWEYNKSMKIKTYWEKEK